MDKSNLFSIGEFSRLTGVTTKALKYYERKNILKPTWIDPESGYRYYRLQQIYQLNLIGLFTDLDMCLNQFCNYIDEDYQHVDYAKILEAGKSITKERIQTLEDKMRYIEYLENNTRHLNYNNNIRTSPVWLLPCEGIPNKNNIERAVKKILHDTTMYGLTLTQSYGLLMICNGNENRIYYFADIKFPSKKSVIHENIFYLPQGSYRNIEQKEWNIHLAPKLFKKLFAMNYDKIVIERELTYNMDSPSYILSCLLPPES